jgi:hypothetical protein
MNKNKKKSFLMLGVLPLLALVGTFNEAQSYQLMRDSDDDPEVVCYRIPRQVPNQNQLRDESSAAPVNQQNSSLDETLSLLDDSASAFIDPDAADQKTLSLANISDFGSDSGSSYGDSDSEEEEDLEELIAAQKESEDIRNRTRQKMENFRTNVRNNDINAKIWADRNQRIAEDIAKKRDIAIRKAQKESEDIRNRTRQKMENFRTNVRNNDINAKIWADRNQRIAEDIAKKRDIATRKAQKESEDIRNRTRQNMENFRTEVRNNAVNAKIWADRNQRIAEDIAIAKKRDIAIRKAQKESGDIRNMTRQKMENFRTEVRNNDVNARRWAYRNQLLSNLLSEDIESMENNDS